MNSSNSDKGRRQLMLGWLCVTIFWALLIWMGALGYQRGVLFSAGTEWYWAHVVIAVMFTAFFTWLSIDRRKRR